MKAATTAERERAFLAGVVFTGVSARKGVTAATTPFSGEESLSELADLVRSAGAEVAGELLQRRARPDAALFLGSGKIAELRGAVAATHANLLVVDGEPGPSQQRNLERELDVRVISRTQLILDIFARHARTREGQLQVELAQLEYLLPRLVGHGAAMSRLGGGIGTRGPGETKLETDRRRIHARIRGVRQLLERVRTQRGQQRRQRESVPLATIALVGYTNAGKSSLFNRLTGAGVLTSARMFATLDPTLRQLTLPSGRKVLLSDTVGFLRNLPHSLIDAFRATLEEVTRARLLVVVSDAAAPHRDEHESQVQAVLHELAVEATPQLRVFNKADLLTLEPRLAGAGDPPPLLVSARTGAGLESLLAAFDRALAGLAEMTEEVRLRIPYPAGKLLHWLHQRGEILDERYAAKRVELVARVPVALLANLNAYRVK